MKKTYEDAKTQLKEQHNNSLRYLKLVGKVASDLCPSCKVILGEEKDEEAKKRITENWLAKLSEVGIEQICTNKATSRLSKY